MKIKGNLSDITREYSLDGGFRVTFHTDDQSAVNALAEFKKDALLDLEIKKHRKKRSLDANAYMWVLCDRIAEKANVSREDVYRRHIRDNGVYTDVAVIDAAAGTLISGWEDRGIGWFTELFDSTLKGCRKVRLYYGSSVYDSAQMSRLIEDVVYEAKNLGIETMTPGEVEELKAAWESYEKGG